MGGPIGKNSIVKNSENFSERNAKNFVKIPYRYREIVKKTKKLTDF